MVAGVGSTVRKLPALFSCEKKSTPGWMSSAVPLFCRAASSTAAMAAPACVGSPLILVVGAEEILQRLRRGDGLRVVADRHETRVVVDPEAGRLLVVGGDVIPRLDLVRRELVGVRERDGGAEVERVGRGVLALEVLGGLDLLRARHVGVGRVDRDAVLVLERGDDLAVVGPVVGQRDHVELTLGLRGRDEGVHAAEVGGAGGLRRVAGGAAAPGGVGRAGARGEGERERRGGGSRHEHGAAGTATGADGGRGGRVHGSPPMLWTGCAVSRSWRGASTGARYAPRPTRRGRLREPGVNSCRTCRTAVPLRFRGPQRRVARVREA